MNVHRVLLFCFFSVLSGGNTGLINAQTIFTRTEGEDLRHNFTVNDAERSRKFLCRNDCNKGDILIETHSKSAQSGRYIIRYDGVLNVVISALTQSDTGRYRFGVGNSSSQGSFQDFEIRVNALCDEGLLLQEERVYSGTEGANITVRCLLPAAERNRKFLCREDCEKFLIQTTDVVANTNRYSIKYDISRFFTVTISQLTKSDSGQYRCGVRRQSSENQCYEFKITVTDGYTLPLVVCLIVIVLLAVSLLLLYKWKKGIATRLNWLRTLTGRNMEFAPYDNSAPAPTLEGPTYANIDSPTYETLNHNNSTHDLTYSTLGQ